MYYLKPTDRTPTEPFKAIKVNGEFHPCTYQSDAKNGKYEAFVSGWKKAKKAYDIPLFAGTGKEEFESYLATWGKYCLFYSITGYPLDSGDCVVWAAKQEFMVLLSVGYDYVKSMYDRLIAINDKIIEATKKQLGVAEITYWMDTPKGLVTANKLFLVKPHYSIAVYLLTAPHIDPISDDDKLWKHFIETYKPTEQEMDSFPDSVKDRLTFLFGEDVSQMYEAILNDFPLTYNPEKTRELKLLTKS